MRSVFPVALVFVAALLSYWLLGCGILQPVRHATPGGIDIVYHQNDGDYRLPREKVREIDARHAALLECIPASERCTSKPPPVRIKGGCDTYLNDYGQRDNGAYVWGRVEVPGSLKALAHEFAHHYTCTADPVRDGKLDRDAYKLTWMSRCGDVIDAKFRRLYPPNKCAGDP